MTGSYKAQRLAALHDQARAINSEVEHMREDPGIALDVIVQTYVDGHEGVTYAEAMERVLRDPKHAALARRYRAAFPRAHEKDFAAKKS